MLFKFFSCLVGCMICGLSILSSPVFAVQQANFSWLPNEEENLAGYKIYYGTSSAHYQSSVDVSNPDIVNNVVQATVNGLEAGITYYFAATAYDTDGNESAYSQEISWSYISVDELIIDNGDPETAMSGSWSISGGVNYYGTQSVYSKTVNGSYTYNANISGPFELSLWWTEYRNRCTNVPIEVYDNNTLIDSFDINQQNNGGQWNVVGDYDIIGPVRVVVISTSTICSTNADAVRFIRTTKKEQPVTPPSLPVANNLSLSAVEDTEAVGQLDGESLMGAALNYQIVSNGALGKASITNKATGSFVYTPNENASGVDTFSYKINDVYGESSIAIVTVTINPINDAPIAYDGTLNVQVNKVATGALQGSDVDSSQLTYTIISNGILGTATVDPVTGSYYYTPNEGAYGEDSFQFIVSDGNGESNQATIHITIQQETPSFAMEIGELTVDGTWTYISFAETFQDPIVVAKPASNNDPSPCVVRIRNVTQAGFEIRLQQFDYLAEEHGEEIVSFIAMEGGIYTLDDGTLLEAGRFATDKTSGYENVNFSQLFSTVPVVSASVLSVNEEDAVVGRIYGIDETGFRYKLQEQEANAKKHALENIAYIAWEPSVGMIGDLAYEVGTTDDVVTHTWHTINFSGEFTDAPVFVSDLQTTGGGDPANLRYENLTAATVKIKVAEEASRDSEVSHATENVGFMAFSVENTYSEVTIDNGDAGTIAVGNWLVSSASDPYGTGSLYSRGFGATYTYQADLSGTYEVLFKWTKSSRRCTNVPVEIYDGMTLLDTVSTNQQLNGIDFEFIDTYTFTGDARVVVISVDDSCSTSVDAVKFAN